MIEGIKANLGVIMAIVYPESFGEQGWKGILLLIPSRGSSEEVSMVVGEDVNRACLV